MSTHAASVTFSSLVLFEVPVQCPRDNDAFSHLRRLLSPLEAFCFGAVREKESACVRLWLSVSDVI